MHYQPRRGKMIYSALPRGIYERTYTITEEHRKHLSISAKKWWAVPTNKERMSKIQTGNIGATGLRNLRRD